MKDSFEQESISDSDQVLARYHRAEAMESEIYRSTMVLNAQISPKWIRDSPCFWYLRHTRRESDIATEYRLVNTDSGVQTPLFNHQRLAETLAQVTAKTVNPDNLPISKVKVEVTPVSLTFCAFEKYWRFDTTDETCHEIDVTVNRRLYPAPSGGLISPDGTKVAFTRDYNVWVTNLEDGTEWALTQNGERYNAYGVEPESRDLVQGLVDIEPFFDWGIEAMWSPDSKSLFTYQLDERQVRNMPSMLYVPQDGTVAPRVIERKYALPGDINLPQYRLVVIDVETCSETPASYPAVEDSFVWLCPFSGNRAWWSGDSKRTYFIDMTRGQKTARLLMFDTVSGEVILLFEESSDTYLDLGLEFESPSVITMIAKSDELIWYSERTGWAHLYLYDLTTGNLKNPVTSGEWRVRDVVFFDSARREIFLQIAGRVEGRNPYYREIVKVHIDSGEMTILATGDYDCSICGYPDLDDDSPRCKPYLIINRSRVDCPSITEVIDRDGQSVLTLEEAEVSGLPSGWTWPEAVTLKACDDKTDIYSLVFRPSDFDASKSYPVLDLDTATPFYTNYPTGAFHTKGNPGGNLWYISAASIAELGFIVTIIMGRGTPSRSKDFHDFGYDSFMDGGGIVDHVSALKQLSIRFPNMDLNRVGIMKPDAPGNGAVFGLLKYPEFYKVGVSFSVWDPRLVKQGEIYHGVLKEIDDQLSVWSDFAQNLQGKLLLVTGLIDQYFHSSMTFQLIDVLVKANKDFDMLIQPNGGHGWRVKNAQRRVWDFLVNHLQNSKPPKNYSLQLSYEKMAPKLMPENIM